MKTLIFVFAVMCALPMFTSCIKDKPADNEQTDEFIDDTDTVMIQEVTGVAVDGAMNSVYLLVGNDTVEFAYPDLDSDVRDSWDINDTLTIKYVETQSGDSVVQVINEALT